MKNTLLAIVIGLFFSVSAYGEVKIVPDNPTFQIATINDSSVTVKVPLIENQLTEECLKNPQWQISAGYCYLIGADYFRVARKNYEVPTGPIEKNHANAIIKFDHKGDGKYWVRVYGKDKTSGRPLWINQYDEFCRLDINGNPGYEFIFNLPSGEFDKVPDDFEKWK